VVVDDASTDDSVMEIRNFTGAYGLVRLIRHTENKGYSTAKNTGVIAALDMKADFIVQLDADDILTPESVKLRAECLIDRPQIDLAHGLCERFYGHKNGRPDLRGVNPKTYVHAQGRMYRADVYRKYGLYYEVLRSIADKEYVYRLGVHPQSPLPHLILDKRLKKVVAWYRKHDTQMHRTRKQHPKYNDRLKGVFKRRIKQLMREGITKDNTRFP
jgi:glycosyltransferase involved in cell wall biosynthesis